MYVTKTNEFFTNRRTRRRKMEFAVVIITAAAGVVVAVVVPIVNLCWAYDYLKKIKQTKTNELFTNKSKKKKRKDKKNKKKKKKKRKKKKKEDVWNFPTHFPVAKLHIICYCTK